MRIRGDQAWQHTLENPNRLWHGDRFSAPVMVINHEAKFRIPHDASYFCIGSCFARNIEEHLLVSGAMVLSKKAKCPPKEGGLRNNSWLNKFTTASILNDIEWALDRPKYDTSWFEQDSNGWRDLQLSPGVSPVEEVIDLVEQRNYVSCDYFSRIADADILVITLGLNEVWWDDRCKRFLNATPQRSVVRREPDRFWLIRSNAQENTQLLENIYSAVNKMKHGIKIVITVSPVPMETTFSGEDILLANTYSKSTLISAARAFSETKSDVDYYPSFEMISFSHRNAAYASDGVHVQDDIVGSVTTKFIEAYTGVTPANPHKFRELAYLAANPDVERLVKDGDIGSGYEHWNTVGQQQQRPLQPLEATDRMRAAGAV